MKSFTSKLRIAILILCCLINVTLSARTFAADTTPDYSSQTVVNNLAANDERRFRETNDVLYYDQCTSTSSATSNNSSTTGSGTSSTAGNGDGGGCGDASNGSVANEQQVYNYFMTQLQASGYSQQEAQQATAGILGNWEQESAFNPARSDGQGCGSSAAYGIAQWCGGRIDKVKAYNADHGRPADCLGGELEYAWSEMEADGVITKMKGQSAGDAAATYMNVFEAASIDGNREGKAQTIYQEIQSNTLGASLQSGGSSAATSTAAPSGSSASSGSSSCASGGTAAKDNGECKNPFRDLQGSGVSRIDGGYDYGGSNGSGPVYATCPATIVLVQTGGSGWPGLGTDKSGAYIKYQITSGKAKGLYMYIAEDCTPSVQVGDQVDTNKPICNYKDQGTELEIGWASGSGGTGYVDWSDYPQHDNNWASNSGVDVDKFLQTLGLPHDNVNEGPDTGSPPANWPKWTT